MSDAEVNIHIKASNETTAAINEAQASISGLAQGITEATAAGVSAVISYQSMERSEVALDRANVMVERSTRTVETAQTALNTAIAKYGVDSPEATKAANDLKIAQDALTVATERQGLSQMTVNDNQMRFAADLLPAAMLGVKGLTDIYKNWGVVTEGLTAVQEFLTGGEVIATATEFAHAAATGILSAAETVATAATTALAIAVDLLGLPIIIVIAAIAALIIVLKYLYDNNETVRNGINNLIATISGVFTTGIQVAQALWTTFTNAIRNAWDSLVQPLVGIIQGFANSIVGFFQWIWSMIVGGSSWTSLCQGIVGLWNGVVQPLIGVAQGWASALSGVFSGLSAGISSIWGGITGAIRGAASTIGGIVSGVISSVASAWGTVSNFVSNAASAVSGAVSSAQSILSGIGTSVSNVISNVVQAVTGTSSGGYVTPGGGASPVGGYNLTQHGFEGVVTKPTGFIAGEAGPEPVAIGETAIRNVASRGGGVSGNVTLNFNFPNVLTLPENPQAIDRLFEPYTRRILRNLKASQ